MGDARRANSFERRECFGYSGGQRAKVLAALRFIDRQRSPWWPRREVAVAFPQSETAIDEFSEVVTAGQLSAIIWAQLRISLHV